MQTASKNSTCVSGQRLRESELKRTDNPTNLTRTDGGGRQEKVKGRRQWIVYLVVYVYSTGEVAQSIKQQQNIS